MPAPLGRGAAGVLLHWGGGGKNCTWIPVVFSGRRAVRCHGFIPESWSVCWDPSGTMEMEES